MAMVVPVAAAEVTTSVTVGTNSTAPYMIASTMTPDDSPTAGVQVNPEFAIPNSGGTFTGLADASNGWRIVKFYVEVGHINGVENIDNVAIDVTYPVSFLDPSDAILFGDRAGDLKFEINAKRDGPITSGVSSWTSQIVYPFPESYPDGTAASVPMLHVRQLVYGSTTPPNQDIVDVNADLNLDGLPDQNWHDFLTTWGDRISYAGTYNAASAFDKYQLGQAIVLEIKGYMWFHQPGVKYTVDAKAATAGGATSDVLGDNGKFLTYNRVIGLYIDFNTVNYLDVSVGNDSWAEGDRFLNTPSLTTVWNNGNVSAQVLVDSTKMVKDFAGTTVAQLEASPYYNSAAKTIEHFDAKLYYTNGAGVVQQMGDINYLASQGPVVISNISPTLPGFGPLGEVLLQACRPAKIEFSVHPELQEAQEAGSYKGFLTLSVEPYTGIQPVTL